MPGTYGTRWQTPRVLSFLLLCGVALAPAAAQQRPGVADSPNILVLIADDAGWRDSGAYGNPGIRTPSIDRLAREGMKVEHAYLTIAQCSPSRISILTGKYPHATGAEDLHMPLPEGERPFFLWVGFNDPHRPYQGGAIASPHDPARVQVPPYLADTPETRADLALYYDEIARMDAAIGRMLDELERRGLRENTLVLYLSDNGMPFPRAKGTNYDEGIRTPLLLSWPRVIRPGTVYDRGLVSVIDLAPTFLELAGASPAPQMQGRSILDLLTEPQSHAGREHVFSERNWHNCDEHIRSVRTARFKLIRTDDDLARDPWEMHNVADDPAHADTVRALARVLHDWMRDTGDFSAWVRVRDDDTDRVTGVKFSPEIPPMRHPEVPERPRGGTR